MTKEKPIAVSPEVAQIIRRAFWEGFVAGMEEGHPCARSNGEEWHWDRSNLPEMFTVT